jgi:hypothetical protein
VVLPLLAKSRAPSRGLHRHDPEQLENAKRAATRAALELGGLNFNAGEVMHEHAWPRRGVIRVGAVVPTARQREPRRF